MPDSIAIKLENVSKKYTIGKEKDGSLRGTLGTVFSKKSAKQEDFWALKDVSFDIQKGDVVGIIGKNGAGKSTLLKILSQITKPTEGRIEINGRVASLLEVGTGFHPELTGRENVYLNGTILGMSRKEVAAKFDEIVAFSGVEKFIDTPVKRYSSGMYVRLAFAVAAHLEPEILIIDEVLAVGDAEFQKKCLGKMKDVAGEGRTVIFVSHDLAAIMSLCSRGVLLESGKIVKVDNIKHIIEKYNNNIVSNNYISNKKDALNYIQYIEIENFKDNDRLVLNFEEKINFNFKLKIDTKNTLLNFGIAFKDFKGNKISTMNKSLEKTLDDLVTFRLSLSPETFYNGNYTIDCAVFEKQGKVYEYLEDCLSFKIVDFHSNLSGYHSKDIGSIKINHEWIF